MKRRHCIAWIAALACGTARADPTAAEQARIDRLIAAVGQRKDIKFIRNGSEYNCEQAAEFLRGKLKWRLDKVATVQDFIEQVGTRSTTSGEIYKVRLADGRSMPSAEFLRAELERIDKR